MTVPQHSHEYNIGRQNDLLEHYDIHQKPLGSGTYGVVYQATQKSSGEQVAIKVIRHLDNPLVCRRTLREIRYLQHFKHDNIITLLDVARPNSIHSFSEACLIQEYMPQNLTQVIAKYELTDMQTSYLTYQMLIGLHSIHRADILHRDLKPDNILVGPNCELKICDFGLARAQATCRNERIKMTEYVATRWYRAPEIMLSKYGKASDVWSSGCVLAEMLGKNVLFPGKDYLHQLDLIFNVLGSPTDDDLKKARYPRKNIQLIRTVLPTRAGKLWNDMFPKASEESLGLLDRLLTFNMDNRITVEDALQHEFFRVWTSVGEGSCNAATTSKPFMDGANAEGDTEAKREYNSIRAFEYPY
jgi:mitogen-activated protein kinase 1/3